MSEQNIIWHHINFDTAQWLQAADRIVDINTPVDTEQLKRYHAIETGIIEHLYSLDREISRMLIQEGIKDSYIQPHHTNIKKQQLLNHLADHCNAIDYVFDFVTSNRRLNRSFLLELHQIITMHQDTIMAVDSLGRKQEVPLLKGKFKELENNPQKADGTICIYCPCIHVDAEIENLFAILSELEEKKVPPIIMAAWAHHAFVRIHPFQDGNGRVARLLSSLILIKHGFYLFTVDRDNRNKYIDCLEAADRNNPQPLIDFFYFIQEIYRCVPIGVLL